MLKVIDVDPTEILDFVDVAVFVGPDDLDAYGHGRESVVVWSALLVGRNVGNPREAQWRVWPDSRCQVGRSGRTLILRVRASGSKHWIWRGTVRGRRRDLGLGTFPYVSLGEAREKAFEYRRLAKAGEDPTVVYAPEGTTEVEPKSPTFRKVAAAVIDLHRPTWRNPKSAAQWEASLRDHAYPVLGDMRVDEISSGDVLRALRPIWNTKRETAQRVRQRIPP